MSRRALVIGIDGMPRTLLRRLARAGVMPRAATLLGNDNDCAELLAPLPEISSTSWATFLTGANPARHGIFGFVDLAPDSYQVFFPNVTHLRAPPLWEHADAAGMRTLCLNVPGTYPAPVINGVVVAGFVAPRLDRAVRPARLLPRLRAMDYELDVEVGDVAADPAGFLVRVRRALTARTRAFCHLLRDEQWDLAVAVLTETDRFQHFMWRSVADEADPLHAAARDFYRLVDDCLGQLVDQAPDAELFVVSDHGFGPADCQFYVNAWLRQQGFLAALEDTVSPQALDGRSRVFALDPARLYVHRRSRFTRGSVSDTEADELVDEIAAALLRLRWRNGAVGPDVDGPPVVDRVYRRAEIYHGPLVEHAPDLVATPAPGVQLRGGWRTATLTAPDALTGTHTRDNAIFYAARGTDVELVDMADVAPSVLAALGVRPSGTDGHDVRRLAARTEPDPVSGGQS